VRLYNPCFGHLQRLKNYQPCPTKALNLEADAMPSTDIIIEAIDKIILDPRYADFLAVLKAARNGAVYGAKVRFPHALVMIFLFRSGTIKDKLRLVYKATRTHALNLAKFASIYKVTLLALRQLRPMSNKEGRYDALLAGLLGGYLVFGRASPRSHRVSSVSQQIVIYVFARAVLSAAKVAVRPETGIIPSINLEATISRNAWPVFAAGSWGAIMYLFRWYPDTVQNSLQSSMRYIYVDCDEWDGLRTLLWHNK